MQTSKDPTGAEATVTDGHGTGDGPAPDASADPHLAPLDNDRPAAMDARWGDLKERTIWGVAMAAVGTVELLLGGVWFQIFVVFLVSLMMWELWMVLAPGHPTGGTVVAVLSGAVFSGVLTGEGAFLPLILLVPALVGAIAARRNHRLFTLSALWVLAAGWALVSFRADPGLTFIVWLVLVVVVTDVMGYFGGRIIGGPKFWPRVSPKKTWAGILCGWAGAGAVGFGFAASGAAGPVVALIVLSVATSFASQMGDIAESAVKRYAGVKDSSALIPGHGGVLDRFDALLGAVLALGAVAAIFGTGVFGF